MSVASSSLRLTARSYQCRKAAIQSSSRSIVSTRNFTATSGCNVHKASKTSGEPGRNNGSMPSAPAEFEEELYRAMDHAMVKNASYSKIRRALPDKDHYRLNAFTKPRKQAKQKPGFFNLNERDGLEDPEFEEDDVSSIAHGELEQHREFREYARLAAWEMPLLTKMAKPFVPPTSKEVLRFRYTTYMGEQHPAEKKVVLEFCPGDMPDLTPIQREKLKKLVGVRYNPEKDIIKMSSEMFEQQEQNKRYLGDLVDTLLREARDPTDTFEDVPLDLRHHRIKTKPKFPVEWRMTDARRAEIQAVREQILRLDEEREYQGAIIDGVAQIQDAYAARRTALNAKAEAIPELISAGGRKGRNISMRR